jgi:hypothetical protein
MRTEKRVRMRPKAMRSIPQHKNIYSLFVSVIYKRRSCFLVLTLAVSYAIMIFPSFLGLAHHGVSHGSPTNSGRPVFKGCFN